MNIFKKLYGKAIYGIAKVIGAVFDGLIFLTSLLVTLVKDIAKFLLAIISMGGCLLIFLLMQPIGLFLLFNPIVLLIILLFILIPFLGTKLVSYLKYRKYMITEFLYEYSDFILQDKKKSFSTFKEYGDRYRRMEEDKRREEWARRQAEQQRMWEERFRQWNQQQGGQGGFGGQGTWWYGQTGSGQQGGAYTNPAVDFKRQYEESCDLLGVNYQADKYEIKLAYRQKAKEYHPDINKAANATEIFQEINQAYEFLSDANIERYKSLTS